MKRVLIAAVLSFSLPAHAKFAAVQFEGANGVKLNARVYEPVGNSSNSPAILLVEGFGKSHLDKEPESSPFFQLAQALSDQSFTVLTFSKRGSSSNSKNGSWAKSTFWLDNQDAQAAFDFLKSYNGVDQKRIYLFGQSIGCLHTSILAQKNPVKGLIVFAGGYQNFLNILEEQNLVIMDLMGKKPEAAKKEIAPMMQAYSDLKAGKLDCEKYKSICRTEDGETIVDDSQEKYMAEVFKLDPLTELGKVTVPVLVMQGTSDFVISPNQFELARKSLGAKKNFSFKSLGGVDHFMSDQIDRRGSLQALTKIKQTKTLAPISPKLVNATKEWLKFQESQTL
jgi:dipeptidyl aminopeptidase/acylaminoacyl peptidase